MWKIRGIPVKTITVYCGIQILGILFMFVGRAKEFTLRIDTLKSPADYVKYINESDKVWFVFMFLVTAINTIFQCYWWNSNTKSRIHKK